MRNLWEPLFIFGLTMSYIWKLRFSHPASWIVIPALMILSHLLRHETPRFLGFKLSNFRKSWNELVPILALCVALVVMAGAAFHSFRRIGFSDALLAVAAYLPWGLAQEYALNGYFLNRFDAALSRRSSSLVTAGLFCLVHLPNPFLMAVTLPLGWCATRLYRRNRNLYVLGIAHAIVGILLYLVAPDAWSRHLRIGPGWFRPY